MAYTTHGLMTPADLADHRKLTDTGPHPDCDGHDQGDAWGDYDGTVYCTAAENCPDRDAKCPACGGPLASDGVCADDTCGDDDGEGLPDDLSYEEMYSERA